MRVLDPMVDFFRRIPLFTGMTLPFVPALPLWGGGSVRCGRITRTRNFLKIVYWCYDSVTTGGMSWWEGRSPMSMMVLIT